MRKYARERPSGRVFFIDPPYTAGEESVGDRLYTHFQINHERLFEIVSELGAPFVMTYDDNEYVRTLVKSYGFEMREVSMRNTEHRERSELLIGDNMEWLEDAARELSTQEARVLKQKSLSVDLEASHGVERLSAEPPVLMPLTQGLTTEPEQVGTVPMCHTR